MDVEYQWRKAIEKFGTTTVAKACAKLSELQKADNWRYPKRNKKTIVTSIRADMIMILSTLYDFIKRAKIAGKMKDKEKSILNYIDNKLVDFERKKWYNGISGASTGIIGALRIVNSHNESAGSTVIGESLLKQFGLVDPSK